MSGYNSKFLEIEISMPTLSPADKANSVTLPYTHHTVVLNKERRLAFYSAFNSQLPFGKGRDGKFTYDTRVAKEFQAGNEFYKNNDWDRGHLAGREFVDWGSDAEALKGDKDSFLWPNISPQHKNAHTASGREWSAMEDTLKKVMERSYQNRLSAFAGCIFRDSDDWIDAPNGDWIYVPQAFWCVAAWRDSSKKLRTVGYVIDNYHLIIDEQTGEVKRYGAGTPDDHPIIDNDPTAKFVANYSRWSLKEIEAATGLTFDADLKQADTTRRTVARL